eukprot:jgi/Picsp_1/6854/NSC_04191-R1_hypothetical protein CHLNCDRAFT_134681 [Chlorella variabilis]
MSRVKAVSFLWRSVGRSLQQSKNATARNDGLSNVEDVHKRVSSMRDMYDECGSKLRRFVSNRGLEGNSARANNNPSFKWPRAGWCDRNQGAGTVDNISNRLNRSHNMQGDSARSIVTVDVHGGKVDRALRMLRRKLIDEGVRDTWLKQRVYVKPCQERKQCLGEAKRRRRTQEFKEKLRWILRRKSRDS